MFGLTVYRTPLLGAHVRTFPASASWSLVTGLDTGTGVDPGGRLKSESLALTPNSMGGTGRTPST